MRDAFCGLWSPASVNGTRLELALRRPGGSGKGKIRISSPWSAFVRIFFSGL